ncbi:Y-family DNA polymerase [Lacticaseibacillus daqingensis]|uniref:Y-family DNA polymerase n=1 Tax=Lacticaseibacillus daqingensis TaxID=2486014 RepID=UPI000F79513A|nr:excinuclease ABC subunit A [Lacticaseibacillus daqingensis]
MLYDNEPRGVYFLIDNKSFYASIECTTRGLNPLKTALVVMSDQANTNGGLILATSPLAKQRYGLQANVSRQRDLPQDDRLLVVPPRMTLYIQRNLAINAIFRRFTAPATLWPYSIDESILDMTATWRLFGTTPRAAAQCIQRTVQDELGLYTTIGIGENPLQAKLALDLLAKHTPDLIGSLSFDSIPEKLWTITTLTDVWSIAHRTAKRLRRLHITSLYALAHTDPAVLKVEFGLIGTQLFALSWGIDRSQLAVRPVTRAPSLGNSQVLPRDYAEAAQIEVVIKEIAEQVAARLRHHRQQAGTLSLSIGFSYAASETTGRTGFSHAMRIPPTDQNGPLVAAALTLFHTHWHGEVIRNIAITTSHLSAATGEQLNLFEPVRTQLHRTDLARVTDEIRTRFGFTKLVYAKSKLLGGTAINRASLVGGHNGGNAYE